MRICVFDPMSATYPTVPARLRHFPILPCLHFTPALRISPPPTCPSFVPTPFATCSLLRFSSPTLLYSILANISSPPLLYRCSFFTAHQINEASASLDFPFPFFPFLPYTLPTLPIPPLTPFSYVYTLLDCYLVLSLSHIFCSLKLLTSICWVATSQPSSIFLPLINFPSITSSIIPLSISAGLDIFCIITSFLDINFRTFSTFYYLLCFVSSLFISQLTVNLHRLFHQGIPL